MCGIAGFYIKHPDLYPQADAMLKTMLSKIDSRGGQATGFVAFSDDGVTEWQKAGCDAFDFERERRRVPLGSHLVLGHTRWATQGNPGFNENNHPLKRGPFFVIHNGHIENDDELFELSGRQRFGRVDSEALAARMAHYETLDSVPEMMAEVEGAAAIAAVDERDTTLLAIARGGWSPCMVLDTRRITLFASTTDAVLEAHRRHIGTIGFEQVRQMPEGMVLWVTKDGLTSSQFEVKKYTSKWQSQTSGYTGGGTTYTGKYGTGYTSSWGGDEHDPFERSPSRPALPPAGGSGSGSTAGSASTSRAPVDEGDILNCDSCGEYVDWKFAKFVDDGELTWVMCKRCEPEWKEYLRGEGGGTEPLLCPTGAGVADDQDQLIACVECSDPDACTNGCEKYDILGHFLSAVERDDEVDEDDEDYVPIDANPIDPRFVGL